MECSFRQDPVVLHVLYKQLLLGLSELILWVAPVTAPEITLAFPFGHKVVLVCGCFHNVFPCNLFTPILLAAVTT